MIIDYSFVLFTTKLIKYLVRVKVLAYAFVRDWVRVRVGIR